MVGGDRHAAAAGPVQPVLQPLLHLCGHAFVEAWLEDGQEAPSATPFYASANWAERTVYDMFGIRFSGHPDLRRIYLPDDFGYSPLRKEFPRRGVDPQDFPQE